MSLSYIDEYHKDKQETTIILPFVRQSINHGVVSKRLVLKICSSLL